jgi:MFS family permease
MALGAVFFLLAFAISLAVRPAPALPLRRDARSDPHGGGLSVVRHEREPRALVAGLACYQLLRGSLPVLIVILAVEVLGQGEEAVGILNAAIGLGAVIGAAAYATFARRRRLSRAFTAAGIAMGVSAALAGLAPSLLLACAALAIGGAGRATAEVTGLTLLQRTVPIGHRGSVFGILESVGNLALAAGAILGAVLAAWIGAGPALLVAGLATLLVPVVTWPIIRLADDRVLIPPPLLRLLQRVPMFGPLSLCTVEELASGAERIAVPPGRAVISEGDRGDRFYVVESGELATTIEGHSVRTLAAGDSFGEIALLRDVPRTATITTIDDTVLLAIDRDHFMAAVMGRAEATIAADSVVGERLGRGVDP